MTTKYTGNTKTTREQIPTGSSAIIPVDAAQCTIVAEPGAEGSILVEFTISAGEHIEAGDAIWAPAQGMGVSGVVTLKTLDVIPSAITAVRVTANDADGRVEVAQ
jgi:hypothetical protein